MALSLDDLVKDGRLERLFSTHGRDCALQLWVLQIKSDNRIENRLLYGRLLPYNHSSHAWFAPAGDHFEMVGEHRAQIIRLSLYIKSTHTAPLLKHLSDGHTVEHISKDLNLKLPLELAGRIGTTTLSLPLVYRPVAYLLNRDARDQNALLSPHGSAGAFSASLTPINKVALLRTGLDFDEALATFIVKHLDSDTGLDFGNRDLNRLGDMELLVFPTLDDSERELLSVGWKVNSRVLAVKLNPIQLPHYNKFHVRLSVLNDSQLVHSSIAIVECVVGSEFECEFEVPEQLRTVVDETEVEIYGFTVDDDRTGFLCCRWRIGYFRQITINSQLAGQGGGGSVRFDWLEKVTKSAAASQRLRAAQAINQGGTGFLTHVGDREADPWVPVNRGIRSLFTRAHPPQSDGRFFDRLSDGDGLGRLEFVEWVKDLLVSHHNHQVIIFDPYFEDAGMGLVVPNAGSNGDYIVFTSLPRPEAHKASKWYTPLLRPWVRLRNRRKPPVGTKTRINNLLASCEQLKPLMKRVRLRVYGLKYATLHDRYFLIANQDGTPAAGFHLSNSIQKANENYPLLITPIPPDVLLKVHNYASGLLTQAFEAPSGAEADISKVQLLFDSKAVIAASPKRIEPLPFLDEGLAGDVLAGWTGEQSLRGLEGDALRERMRNLGLLKDESLVLPNAPGLKGCVDQQAGNFINFSAKWDVLGEILANSHAGDMIRTVELSAETAFLVFLAGFLNNSFGRVHNEEVDAPLAHVASTYFQKSIETLLAASYRPEHFFHPVKYAALSWSEFFAVQVLWCHVPDVLLSITEAQAATVLEESRQSDAVKLSLLSQIVSEVALGAQFGLADVQRDRLIRSPDGLLKWMGMNFLESQLEKPNGVRDVVQYTASFSHRERILVLGWMIQRSAGRRNGGTIFRALVDSLHEVLPPTITAEDSVLLVDSMRGHMRKLGWGEPWLYRDVIFPLLEEGRISADDLCSIWVKDLLATLEQALMDKVGIFKRRADGSVTEVAAFLFGHSGVQQQRATIAELQSIFVRVRRDVRQPLASTSNWNKWNISIVVSMWIYAFTKWAAHFLVKPSEIEAELERLSIDARSVALVRPIIEWQSDRGVEPAALAKFIEEVGGI
jgi:hypothetical protein